MQESFKPSFKQQLARILRENNEISNNFACFGNNVATRILQEIKIICKHIDSVKNSTRYYKILKSEYSETKILPKIYEENGFSNCGDLFFEHRFDLMGGYASVEFYIPYLFKTEAQKEEVCLFTKKEQLSDPSCIAFYFVTYFLPERNELT